MGRASCPSRPGPRGRRPRERTRETASEDRPDASGLRGLCVGGGTRHRAGAAGPESAVPRARIPPGADEPVAAGPPPARRLPDTGRDPSRGKLRLRGAPAVDRGPARGGRKRFAGDCRIRHRVQTGDQDRPWQARRHVLLEDGRRPDRHRGGRISTRRARLSALRGREQSSGAALSIRAPAVPVSRSMVFRMASASCGSSGSSTSAPSNLTATIRAGSSTCGLHP